VSRYGLVERIVGEGYAFGIVSYQPFGIEY